MTHHERLLNDIRQAPQQSSDRASLLTPLPLAHSKELEAQLPRLRRHVGPRPWYQWLEQHAPE